MEYIMALFWIVIIHSYSNLFLVPTSLLYKKYGKSSIKPDQTTTWFNWIGFRGWNTKIAIVFSLQEVREYFYGTIVIYCLRRNKCGMVGANNSSS